MTNENQIPEDCDKFAPDLSERYFSIGYLCQLLRINPGQLRVLMEDTGTKFVRMVDGVLYVNGEDIQTIVDAYNRIIAEITSVAASTANN